MKFKSILIVAVLALALTPTVAGANVRPVVESFTFSPNDLDLISANTNVTFELVVFHPSGIKNTTTQVNLAGPNGSTLAANLVRTDLPVNTALTKVTFKGVLTIPQGIAAGAYSVSVAEVGNNSSAGYEYTTDVITPSKLRDLLGAENALLVRSGGDLNLSYDTFVGPTHNTTVGVAYNNPALFNNNNPPIWKVGESYLPSKYFELRVPSLQLVLSTTTPTICSTDGKELKLIATGSCTFKVSTAKTKDYALKESATQVVTISAARSKPELIMSVIANQTSKNLPKTIEIFRVYSPTGVYILPQATTPTVCIASGFYVQIVGGGTCTLTYQSEANTSYLASDLYKVSFEVTRDPQTITFAPVTTADIATKSLTLTATASSGGAIIFSSTTNENCTISGSTLNLLKSGNCIVTASQAGTSTLAPVSASTTITLTGTVVTPKPVVTTKTIICIKGKTTKKVSGTNPKCPKSYKVKK